MTVTVYVERFYGHDEVGEFETNNTNPEDIAEDLCDYLLELYPNAGFNIINVNAGDGYIDVKLECMGKFMAQEYFYLKF